MRQKWRKWSVGLKRKASRDIWCSKMIKFKFNPTIHARAKRTEKDPDPLPNQTQRRKRNLPSPRACRRIAGNWAKFWNFILKWSMFRSKLSSKNLIKCQEIWFSWTTISKPKTPDCYGQQKKMKSSEEGDQNWIFCASTEAILWK